MGKDRREMAKRKQKRLEKQHRYRKQKREQARRTGRAGEVPGAEAPLEGCWTYVQDDGPPAVAVIARKMGAGRVGFACFLVDRWGVGIKDAFGFVNVTRDDFAAWFDSFRSKGLDLKPADLTYAQQLIWGGLEYGRANGFRPPREFRRWAEIVGRLPEGTEIPPDMFGKDGKPLIVGDWPDLVKRMERPCSLEELMARHACIIGTPVEDLEADGEEGELGSSLAAKLEELQREDPLPPGTPGTMERVVFCKATLVHEDYDYVSKAVRAEFDCSIDERDDEEPYMRLSWLRDYPPGHWNELAAQLGGRQNLGSIEIDDRLLTIQTRGKSWMQIALGLVHRACGDRVSLLDLEFARPEEGGKERPEGGGE